MTYFPSLLSRCMINTKHMISITPVSNRYSRSSTTAYRNKEGLTLTCPIEGYALEDLSVELQGSILEIKAPGLSPPEDAKLLRKASKPPKLNFAANRRRICAQSAADR